MGLLFDRFHKPLSSNGHTHTLSLADSRSTLNTQHSNLFKKSKTFKSKSCHDLAYMLLYAYASLLNGERKIESHYVGEKWSRQGRAWSDFQFDRFGGSWNRREDDRDGVNLDGSFKFQSQRVEEVGIIVQDHIGNVLGAATQRLEVGYTPQVAEAVTMMCGIDFVVDSRIMPTVVVTNVLKVVNLIKSGDHSLADIVLVCNDIDVRIRTGFITRVQYVPR
ncbi:hypothetical protein Ddye_001705, partial [Dipteronia dyeriana]